MIARLIRVGVTRVLLGPVAVVVLCVLLVWGTAGCSSPEEVPWEDDPVGTYHTHRDRVEAGHIPLRDPSPIGAWVIARGAAMEAGADEYTSAEAAHFARWERDLPCWSASDVEAMGLDVPVCSGGDR